MAASAIVRQQSCCCCCCCFWRRVEEKKRAFHVPDGAAHSFLAKVYAFRACTPGKKKCLFRMSRTCFFWLMLLLPVFYIFYKKREEAVALSFVALPPRLKARWRLVVPSPFWHVETWPHRRTIQSTPRSAGGSTSCYFFCHNL